MMMIKSCFVSCCIPCHPKAYVRTHAPMQMHVQTRARAHTHTHTHTQCAHTHAHTRTCTHTHTHTHTHVHTHTHTHIEFDDDNYNTQDNDVAVVQVIIIIFNFNVWRISANNIRTKHSPSEQYSQPAPSPFSLTCWSHTCISESAKSKFYLVTFLSEDSYKH